MQLEAVGGREATHVVSINAAVTKQAIEPNLGRQQHAPEAAMDLQPARGPCMRRNLGCFGCCFDNLLVSGECALHMHDAFILYCSNRR